LRIIYILLDMTWEIFFKTVLAVIIGGGLLTAVVTIFFQQYFKKRERNDAVEYLALRLAFLFEGYGVNCAAYISEYDTVVKEEKDYTSYFGEGVPIISSIPFEEAHKFLDRVLLNDILDFPQRCTMANSHGDYLSELGDNNGYCTFISEEYIRMGVQAMSIGKQLREKYNLTARELIFGGFNPEKFLKNKLIETEERKERNKQQQADLQK